jgi:hypothetical protein
MDVRTDHQIVAVGNDLMELRDNGDGAVIATATRTSPTGNWAITLTRDDTISLSAVSRSDAFMSMIDNGPAGVAEGHAGYSTLVPHGLEDLA